jgi:hypothetical protein
MSAPAGGEGLGNELTISDFHRSIRRDDADPVESVVSDIRKTTADDQIPDDEARGVSDFIFVRFARSTSTAVNRLLTLGANVGEHDALHEMRSDSHSSDCG